jgi:Ser/Thr protein kinase RdoA (MazF antagonist)
VGGYHETFPLTEQEIDLLFDLICIRLCTSVVLAAFQRRQDPENVYLSISEEHAWDLLARLVTFDPQEVTEQFRAACGMDPSSKKK